MPLAKRCTHCHQQQRHQGLMTRCSLERELALISHSDKRWSPRQELDLLLFTKEGKREQEFGKSDLGETLEKRKSCIRFSARVVVPLCHHKTPEKLIGGVTSPVPAGRGTAVTESTLRTQSLTVETSATLDLLFNDCAGPTPG